METVKEQEKIASMTEDFMKERITKRPSSGRRRNISNNQSSTTSLIGKLDKKTPKRLINRGGSESRPCNYSTPHGIPDLQQWYLNNKKGKPSPKGPMNNLFVNEGKHSVKV